MTLTVYFDGSCEYNPQNGKQNPGGLATYGWLIKNGTNNRLAYGYGEVGRGGAISNNVAEYEAFIKALEAIRDLELGNEELIIYGDSQLIIFQVNGHWSVKKPHLFELYRQVTDILDELPGQKSIQWIPREQNQEADDLSKLAYDIARKAGDKGAWGKRFKVEKKEVAG